MNRTLIVGLVAGALMLTCVCLPLMACSGLAIVSSATSSSDSSNARNPVTSSRTPTPVASSGGSGNLTDIFAAQGTADSFLKGLRDNKDQAAIDLFHDDLKSQYASAREFGEKVDSNNVRPATWGSWNTNYDGKDGTGRTRVSAKVNFKDGSAGTAEFEIGRYSGNLRIYSFNIKHT